MTTSGHAVEISLRVNGRTVERAVEPRMLLSDFIRHELGLTGTHVGCEHGVCGACTVQLHGEPVRSCLMLAVQANGADLRTVEGLAAADGELHPIQTAFRAKHGLQCGFCTPGFLMTIEAWLRENTNPDPSEEELRGVVAGNLCRCTGYQGIVDAMRAVVAEVPREGEGR
jgi:carbon-monoxide dehydrogenase small subunit